jgi:hypothetical protein
MVHIVFIAEENHYKNWIGKNYYDLLVYIRDHDKEFNIHIFWTDEKPDNVQKSIIEINPKLIFIFETDIIRNNTLKFEFIFNMNIPKILCCLDMFYPSMFILDTNMKYINGILHFSNNKSILSFYKDYYPDKYIDCIPSRYINTTKFKDYNLEKKYDILIYGTRTFLYPYKTQSLDSIQNWIKKYENINNTIIKSNDKINFYYLRNKIENIILKHSNKYKIKILPEKCIFDAIIANEDLSKLINQSYITVSCSSIADIMMHKYLEIGASNSVILGNIPTDYIDLFKNNILEVNEFMTDSEILNIIDDGLSDKNKLQMMSTNLYNKIHNEHNYNCAIQNFNNIIDNLIIE